MSYASSAHRKQLRTVAQGFIFAPPHMAERGTPSQEMGGDVRGGPNSRSSKIMDRDDRDPKFQHFHFFKSSLLGVFSPE